MKKFTPFLFSSSLVLPSVGFAMGLSGIQVDSNLNQPFSAKIQLLAMDSIALSEVQVTLASEAEYESVGMERSNELAKVRFSISRDKSGKAILKINSTRPIDEPYLQFLLDIRWPNGKMVRGYTVLLDPPNYKIATKAVVPVKAQAVENTESNETTETASKNAVPIAQSAKTTPIEVTDSDPKDAANNQSAVTTANNEVSTNANSVLANTPQATESAPTVTDAESTNKVEPIVKQAAPPLQNKIDSTPTVLQKPEIATQSQPTPLKDLASDKDLPPELRNIDDEASVAQMGSNRPSPTSRAASDDTPSSPNNKNSQSGAIKVGLNDTLWDIAKSLKPTATANINQVMLALEKSNPQAFIHHNLNGLKQGAVLKVPSSAMIKSIPAQEAVKAVQSQNQAWQHKPTQSQSQSQSQSQAPAQTHQVQVTKSTVNTVPTPSAKPMPTPGAVKSTPHINFRATDIEQTPDVKPGENPGHAPRAEPKPALAVAASAASQAQQSNAFLQSSMSDYVKANEVLKKRLSAAEQENSQLRAELIKLTEMVQEQGIKHQSVKIDLQENANLPNQARDVDLTQQTDQGTNWWVILSLLFSGGAALVWWWQRRMLNDVKVDITEKEAESAVVSGSRPISDKSRFANMENTLLQAAHQDDEPAELEEVIAKKTIPDDVWEIKLNQAKELLDTDAQLDAIPLLREIIESGDEQQRREAHLLLIQLT